MDTELDLRAQTQLVHALRAQWNAELIETTISWLLLSGDTVWKLKKAIRLPFVDYASRAARAHCCAEELRLNSRLAPDLYLGVDAVVGTPAQPRLGVASAEYPAMDYAVRMRRFSKGALFSERLAAGLLDAADIDALAALLAAFHTTAPRAAADSGHGLPAHREAIALATLHGLGDTADPAARAGMASWLRHEAAQLRPLWQQRVDAGRVRECHGDLHLANLLRDGDAVRAFDGVEFDPALRWIDILDDIAFAVMDLDAHGRPDFAFRLLNAWLDQTGEGGGEHASEHAGLAALRFAVVYRALVRAEVAGLQGETQRAAMYFACAQRWTQVKSPWLCITHGLPGSGKSFQSQRLLEQKGAVRLRSDVERKRLFGLPMLADSRAAGLDLYGGDAGQRTYARLFTLARSLLNAGWPVILDAAFLRRTERDAAQALAREKGVAFHILHCEAPEAALRARLQNRRGDPSEADATVLAHLQAVAEPLTLSEQALLWQSAAPA